MIMHAWRRRLGADYIAEFWVERTGAEISPWVTFSIKACLIGVVMALNLRGLAGACLVSITCTAWH